MNKKAILLAILTLVIGISCDFQLVRISSVDTCQSNITRLVLQEIETCGEIGCHSNSQGYLEASCDATEKSFNESLIQYGSGKHFSIEWAFLEPNCAATSLLYIEADVADSCQGYQNSSCQNGRIKFCTLIQPPPIDPPISEGIPAPVIASPQPIAEAPTALVEPLSPPLASDVPPTPALEPLSSPLATDVPLVQQQAPSAAVPVQNNERPLTTFEKVVIAFLIGGWAVAVLFVVLYIYQRNQTGGRSDGYNKIPLVEEHGDHPEPTLDQPKIITAENKRDFQPILSSQKTKLQNISASEITINKTKPLGRGQACAVYEGYWHEQPVAIKIPHDADASKLMRELIVVNKMDPHLNVVQVFGYFEYENRICLVLELCSCPNLENLVKTNLSLSDKFSIAMGIAAGILHLHHSKRPVVHRDLKPSNILVMKSGAHLIPKIADFDYARLLASPVGVTYSTPTTSYAAPEQLAATAASKKEYSFKSDAWAYGAILFYLLTGETPFAVKSSGALKTQRLNKQALVRFNLLDELPTDPFTALMVDITRKCLNDDPQKRPEFDHIDAEFANFFDKFYPRSQNKNVNNTNQ